MSFPAINFAWSTVRLFHLSERRLIVFTPCSTMSRFLASELFVFDDFLQDCHVDNQAFSLTVSRIC
jgi:hypothetical protein